MTETITLPTSLPDDVARYCESRGLTQDLHTAIRVAEEAYQPVKAWKIYIEPDPEVEDEYVIIEVAITGDLQKIRTMQEAFMEDWSRSASPEATWRIRVLWKIA